MRIVILTSVVMAIGCGGPLLDEGTYNVDGDLVSSNCPFAVDDSFSTKWKFKDKGDGGWSLEYEDGDRVSGEEDDGDLVFDDSASAYDVTIDCTTAEVTTISLSPDGDSFSGDVVIGAAISCGDGSSDSCAMEYDVEGEKR